ncbi:MAG TPA: tetratricopeptide repeat protein [Thermoanaerobaculia bacterium]|nr:tetratricopeptide repeat protein [Thermoanaerobaculia bacterium]
MKRAVAAALTLLLAVACFESKSPEKRRLNAIARVYQGGDTQEAVKQLKEFVRAYPNNHTAWTILGNAYEDLDQDRNAADSYRRALALNPKAAEAETGMGILARKRGDDEEAMRRYRHAAELDPKYAQVWSSMSVLALRNGQDKDALRYAEKAWELDDEDATIAANLAVCYHYNGNTQKRDEMTEHAKDLGYGKLDKLQEIYRGDVTLRR